MRMPGVGEQFQSNYRIDAILGEGGFATVFRATDGVAHRSAAIKVLKPDRDHSYSPEMVARFEREVQIVAQLRDSHSVRMFDYGRTDGGLLFMVFELIEGRDLSDVLAEVGTLDEIAVTHILTQVLLALREAHALGLLHRDIKPENIRLFEYLGDPLSVKLLDFGIARATDKQQGPQITKKGELVGTPRYMSPEQLRFQKLTPASDIYSLGVVAYEMLMGSRHMHGRSISDQLDRVAFTQVLALPGSTEERVRDAIAKMLARTPAQRFQTANEVLVALGHDVPVIEQPPSVHAAVARRPIVGALRDATTKRYREIKYAAIGLALLIGGAMAYWFFRPDEAPHVVAPRALPSSLLKPAASADIGVHEEIGAPDVGVDASVALSPQDMGASRTVGCGREPPFTGRERLTRAGQNLMIALPTEYDRDFAHTVLLLYHDTHHTSHAVWSESGLQAVADAGRWIAIAPREFADSKDFVKFFSSQERSIWNPSDAAKAVPIIQAIGEDFCIDETRVVAIGYGEGAEVVENLPCHVPSLRAMATVSYRSKSPLLCDGSPVPYLHITGREDQHLPIEGGLGCSGDVLSLEENEALWRARNGCSDPTSELDNPPNCRSWSCATPFVSCVLNSGRGWNQSPEKPRARIPWKGHCDGPRPKRDLSQDIARFFEPALR